LRMTTSHTSSKLSFRENSPLASTNTNTHAPHRHWHFAHNVFAHHVHVVFKLRRHRHDGGAIGHSALDELLDVFLLVGGSSLSDEIDLVLQGF